MVGEGEGGTDGEDGRIGGSRGTRDNGRGTGGRQTAVIILGVEGG